MILDAVYTRLSGDSTLSTLLSARIYPTTPDENTALPFLVYSLSGSEPQLTLDSAATTTKFSLDISVYDRTQASVANILSSVTTLLQGWRGGSVQGCFKQSESIDAVSPPDGDSVYQGSQTYSVWDTAANIISPPDSTGSITTGPNSVTLSACSHSLRLDCSGLTLDGGPVGGSTLPDQAGHANQYLGTNGTAASWSTPKKIADGTTASVVCLGNNVTTAANGTATTTAAGTSEVMGGANQEWTVTTDGTGLGTGTLSVGHANIYASASGSSGNATFTMDPSGTTLVSNGTLTANFVCDVGGSTSMGFGDSDNGIANNITFNPGNATCDLAGSWSTNGQPLDYLTSASRTNLSGVLTGNGVTINGNSTLADSYLSSNIPRLNLSNLFTTGQFVNGASQLSAGSTATNIPLVVRGAISQTADLTQWKTAVGTNVLLAKMDASGNLTAAGLTAATVTATTSVTAPTVAATTSLTSPSITNTITSASATGLVVKGAASQTGDLTQWQNSGGTVLIAVDKSGHIFKSGNRFLHDSGTNNTFLGNSAGTTGVSGGSNVGIGVQALQAVTSGGLNMAIGTSSMTNITTGGYNVGIGVNTLYSLTGGNNNVAIGLNALLNQTSITSGNTAIGTNALYGDTTGDSNTAIGYQAGYTANGGNANVTGAKNTWLGFNAGPASTTQVSRSIAIGHQAVVDASSTCVIGGTGSDSVQVAINGSTATGQLDINVASASRVAIIAKGAASQTGDLTQWQDSIGAVLAKVKADGSVLPASLSDSAATNSSLFYSTTQSKLCWKDSTGAVNPLY